MTENPLINENSEDREVLDEITLRWSVGKWFWEWQTSGTGSESYPISGFGVSLRILLL